VLGSLLPETNKYPPSNETIIKTPPSLRDWKQKNQQGTFNPIASFANLLQHHQSNTVVEQSTMEEEIVAITFCNGEDGEEEISVMIEDPLHMDSTMMDVMAHDDVLRSYGYHGYETLRYHIKRKSGKVLSANQIDLIR